MRDGRRGGAWAMKRWERYRERKGRSEWEIREKISSWEKEDETWKK